MKEITIKTFKVMRFQLSTTYADYIGPLQSFFLSIGSFSLLLNRNCEVHTTHRIWTVKLESVVSLPTCYTHTHTSWSLKSNSELLVWLTPLLCLRSCATKEYTIELYLANEYTEWGFTWVYSHQPCYDELLFCKQT